MRISDWSSDVCSSDLRDRNRDRGGRDDGLPRDDNGNDQGQRLPPPSIPEGFPQYSLGDLKRMPAHKLLDIAEQLGISDAVARARKQDRSEETTSELQSLMRNSYDVFCMKKKLHTHQH